MLPPDMAKAHTVLYSAFRVTCTTQRACGRMSGDKTRGHYDEDSTARDVLARGVHSI